MKVKEIISSSNAYFRLLESLKTSKGIKKEGLILVAGKKIIPEILNKNFDVENLIYSDAHKETVREWESTFNFSQGIKLPSSLFKTLDDSNTQTPLVVLKAPVIDMFKSPTEGLNVFLALSDPANLGASLRSLKAFEATQVILLKESAHAFLPKVTKAASGTNLLCPLMIGPSINDLQLENPICLDMTGTPLKDFKWPASACLILGEEGKGVPQRLKDQAQTLRIEMSTEVESLSAPIALSIACHQRYAVGGGPS